MNNALVIQEKCHGYCYYLKKKMDLKFNKYEQNNTKCAYDKSFFFKIVENSRT